MPQTCGVTLDTPIILWIYIYFVIKITWNHVVHPFLCILLWYVHKIMENISYMHRSIQYPFSGPTENRKTKSAILIEDNSAVNNRFCIKMFFYNHNTQLKKLDLCLKVHRVVISNAFLLWIFLSQSGQSHPTWPESPHPTVPINNSRLSCPLGIPLLIVAPVLSPPCPFISLARAFTDVPHPGQLILFPGSVFVL